MIGCFGGAAADPSLNKTCNVLELSFRPRVSGSLSLPCRGPVKDPFRGVQGFEGISLGFKEFRLDTVPAL